MSLLETVIYAGLLGFLVVILFDVSIAAYNAFSFSRVSREVMSSAELSLERFLREARDADTIDVASSVLGTHPGKLVLSGQDSNGDLETVTFDVGSEGFRVSVNGAAPIALTSRLASTTSVVFRSVGASTTEAVRLELTLMGANKPVPVEKNFYATAVLRGSY